MNVYDIAIARALSSGGGGGGNPNTVETVTATASNPFGDIDLSKLATALANKEASAYIDVDGSALGAGTISSVLQANESAFGSSGASLLSDSVSSASAFQFLWGVSNGNVTIAKMLSGGNLVNLYNYASALPTTLTIVWHPLPSA